MNKIPQGRAMIYFMILCLLPSFAIGFYIWSSYNSLEGLDQKMEYIQEQAKQKERRQSQNQALRNNYKDVDQFYIDKQLESIDLLQQESEALQQLTHQKNVPEDEATKKRLEFLTGPANAIVFSEGVVQTHGTYQDTTETLSHPVEVSTKDITRILARIEGTTLGDQTPPPGRPQLLILDFKIDKKKAADKNEVFQLNMKLLKREFL